MRVGVLALQGAVEAHEKKLNQIGCKPIRVKKPAHLNGLSAIILPGGESTTMLHLLRLNQLWEPLRNFCQENPAFGVCAGAILLSGKVTHPDQQSLGGIQLEAERNFYGRQLESFETELQVASEIHSSGRAPGVFIRAPRLIPLSEAVRPLAWHGQEAVCFRQGNVLCASFHPELSDDLSFHEYFIKSFL